MKNGYILAIDQGTTGSTVLIINHTFEICGRAQLEFTQYYPKPGWVEHDPQELWTVTMMVVKSALQDAGISPSEILGIGITNQRETSLLWQKSTGQPLTRAIVWQDRRTASFCDQLKHEGLEPVWQKKTGLLIDPYFSGTKVHWMLDNLSTQNISIPLEDIAFGTIDSWLVWNLTGGKNHVTDYSNASRTLLYNIHNLDWDEEILLRLEIPRAILPEVKPSSCIFGETDPDVFYGCKIPIGGIAGDQQAALFGHTCYQKGLAKNTYGTGSFLLMHTGDKPVISKNRLLTTIAWSIGSGPVQYALEGAIFVTGAAIQWLRDGLGILAEAAESEAMADAVQDNNDVYFVPALTGLGAPHWDPYARGLIVGLTRGTTKAHLTRAALESIAFQTCDIVEAMSRESGIQLKELRADGGAVTNKFLMQFQADLLGVPVVVPSITETTALGAAFFAGLSTGFWNSPDELAENCQSTLRYEPRMNDLERRRLYQRWHQALDLSRGWARTEKYNI
ncbi:MAG: glycerol kinase GlpK [FCB group bacterium]|nr:glycerol kinase GlpK [FCB group bacterium]